jgi:magnesium transporter
MAKKRRRRSRRSAIMPVRRDTLGAPPGTLSVGPGAKAPTLRLLAYGPSALDERRIGNVSEIQRGTAPVTWVDVEGTGDAETFRQLGELFGLHPLALEDAIHLHQRPKVDEYGATAFIALRMPASGEHLELEQLGIFLGHDFVVTVVNRDNPCLEVIRERLRQARGRVRNAGADYLAYAIADAVVDSYFPLFERYSDLLDQVESQIPQLVDRRGVAEIYAVRHDLHALRRILWPTREAIAQLARGEGGPITPETRTFLRDCHDHTIQLLDLLEGCRDLAASLMELHASSVSLRMNEVMKVLTLIATIFIPLSFITGLYGMNFDTSVSPLNMPELHWRHGYPFALGLMLLTAGGLLGYFWRKGWLTSGGARRAATRAEEETPSA